MARLLPMQFGLMSHRFYRVFQLGAPRVNEATILSLVSCGLGVAFVSSATRWRCPESVALLPVTDLKLSLPFALIWRKDNASPLLEKFVADVRLLPEVEAYSKH